MSNKMVFWKNYERFVDEGTINPISPKTFILSGLITVCGLGLNLIIYFLAFPDSFVGEHTPIKLFFCTLLYMLGTLSMLGGAYFGMSLIVTRFIPTNINNLVLRCFMYVVQIVLFLLFFIGGFENYISVYGFSLYSKDIKAIKSDCRMMVNSAKDMFSDIETLERVRFDTMSHFYFENQGRNAMYINAVDGNERNTKFTISPSDKEKLDYSAYYDVTYYPNTMTISSLNIVGEYDAEEEALKKEQEENMELLNELLDQNIEITIEIDEPRESIRGSKVILIKRPKIPYYDVRSIGDIPSNRDISLLVKKDGEFFDNWMFSCMDWLNDLWFLAEKGEEGLFEMTLVFGYDEVTGEYTPVSNTIIYTLNGTDDYYHPHFEYESIPLNGTEAEIKGSE
ncbi:MAG: hypothetical protein ACI4JW_00045 [Oscillospiraceae bacterium]